MKKTTKTAARPARLWALNSGDGMVDIYRSITKPTIFHPQDWWGTIDTGRWLAKRRTSITALCTKGFKRATGISLKPGEVRELKVFVK